MASLLRSVLYVVGYDLDCDIGLRLYGGDRFDETHYYAACMWIETYAELAFQPPMPNFFYHYSIILNDLGVKI